MGTYRLKSVAEHLGVSPHTVRAWEKRYRAVQPGRSGSGRRIYSEEEFRRLLLLNELIKQGHSISQIAQLSDKKLGDLKSKHPEKGAKLFQDLYPTAHQHLGKLLESLHGFELETLSRQLEWACLSLACRDFVFEVVAPLMKEVGNLVLSNKMSISQEHALSSVLRNHFSRALQVLQNHAVGFGSGGSRHPLLFTTPEGDQHEFGILLGATLCANLGVPAFYLGPSMPAKDIAESARRLGTSILVLGNLPTAEAQRKETLRKFFEELDKLLPLSVEIWVGGGEPPFKKLFTSQRKSRFLLSLRDFEAQLGAWKKGLKSTT